MFSFLASKLLSFLPFGNFLGGSTFKILLIVGIVAAIGIFIWRYNESIRQAAYEEIFEEQVQQQLEQQQREFEKLVEVNEEKDRIIGDLLKEREELLTFYERTLSEIRSGNLDDDQVAPVLRFTIEEIRKNATKASEVPEEQNTNSVIQEFLDRE